MALDLQMVDEELQRRGMDPAKLSFLLGGQPAQPTSPRPAGLSFVGPKATPRDVPAPEMGQPSAGSAGPALSFANRQPAAPAPTANPADPSAKGAPGLSFVKRFDDELARGQSQVAEKQAAVDAAKPGTLRKLLAVGAGILGGVPRGQAVWNQPKTAAQAEVERTQAQTAGNLAGIAKEAGVADTESQANLRNAQAGAATRKEEDALAQHGLMRDEQGQIVPMPEDRLPPEIRTRMANEKSLATLRESQEALAQAKLELEKAKNDPKSPQFKLAQEKVDMERERTAASLAALGLHQEAQAFREREAELIKPSGQTQSRGSAATSALAVLPKLEALTLDQAKNMGPLIGRIRKGELKIGDAPQGVAELYAAMKSFYALQPAVHGFRNAEFVKDFESALGTLERDPATFLDALKGLRPTLEAVEKEGRTYHRRTVEGGGNAPADGKAPVWNPKTGRYE